MATLRLRVVGQWLQHHAIWIRRVQWGVVALYAGLVITPTLLPLPDEKSHILTNLTVFAQFVFWGIWWPFVLLSMILMGRIWCGVLCPEGTLTEWASSKGRNMPIPRWMRWRGWPFAAFVGTTVYGQLVSVYQYPKAVLLVLGGSTVAAMVVGYLYGREKRVWCKYLCPVNGVFALLGKLAPAHFSVNAEAWRQSYRSVIPIQAINCAPLVAIRHMEGASDCHMCGRCSGHRGAITLQGRSPNHEVVNLGTKLADPWQSVLILFGLLGIAIGAFQWNANPHFTEIKQLIAEWLVNHDILWPLSEETPWWLLTHYPEQRDVFSWLDGALIVAYISGSALALGGALAGLLGWSTRALGPWELRRFHHLCQALIPLAGCGVFLGLSALTVSLLKSDGVAVDWANPTRLTLLAAANIWSGWLAFAIGRRYTINVVRSGGSLLIFFGALALIDYAWALLFWIW